MSLSLCCSVSSLSVSLLPSITFSVSPLPSITVSVSPLSLSPWCYLLLVSLPVSRLLFLSVSPSTCITISVLLYLSYLLSLTWCLHHTSLSLPHFTLSSISVSLVFIILSLSHLSVCLYPTSIYYSFCLSLLSTSQLSLLSLILSVKYLSHFFISLHVLDLWSYSFPLSSFISLSPSYWMWTCFLFIIFSFLHFVTFFLFSLLHSSHQRSSRL